ncbi:MAG: dihydrodipicolinate synthase family protein [Microlunatus sp.]|nr:dihydrodipicolinate synthase family protein [Microlunatus sp.]
MPQADGSLRSVQLLEPRTWVQHPQPHRARAAFAAAHVVADPYAENVPGAPAALDWDATLAFRAHLFRYGLGVAEAMDTAQRNMGLDWAATQELITRSAAQARAAGARITAGAGTDHLPAVPAAIAQVTAAYLEQVAFVEGAGSEVIVMASRHLAAAARTAEDYRTVYDTVLTQVSRPVVLHWLGEVFDPQLAGYWGTSDVATATDTFLELVHDHAATIDGVKVSLLSAEHEVELRRRLPVGVRLYTGDDFNYPELIEGDGEHHSDALLGAFAAIAPAASAALTALDHDDFPGYRAELAPTLPLSRHLFAAPTFYYKTGIAFLAWLSGHQDGFVMVGGLQAARSPVHLSRVFELANAARLLPDPELARHRLRLMLAGAGIGC